MKPPAQVVADFLGMWGTPDGFGKALKTYFTEETVYENVGVSKTKGITETVELFGIVEGVGVVMRVDTLHQASVGNIVLNERVDHFLRRDGSIRLSIPVMGIFRVEQDRISEWRDYFDTATFAQYMTPNRQKS